MVNDIKKFNISFILKCQLCSIKHWYSLPSISRTLLSVDMLYRLSLLVVGCLHGLIFGCCYFTQGASTEVCEPLFLRPLSGERWSLWRVLSVCSQRVFWASNPGRPWSVFAHLVSVRLRGRLVFIVIFSLDICFQPRKITFCFHYCIKSVSKIKGDLICQLQRLLEVPLLGTGEMSHLVSHISAWGVCGPCLIPVL